MIKKITNFLKNFHNNNKDKYTFYIISFIIFIIFTLFFFYNSDVLLENDFIKKWLNELKFYLELFFLFLEYLAIMIALYSGCNIEILIILINAFINMVVDLINYLLDLIDYLLSFFSFFSSKILVSSATLARFLNNIVHSILCSIFFLINIF